MPIIDIDIVLKPREELRHDLALDVANATGEALGVPPGEAWVKVRTIAPECYAESGGGPPEGVCPVFVSVVLADDGSREKRQEQADILATTIATVCGRRKEHVHIIFAPPARGRIAFGGKLMIL
ncbi:MAG: hypothetical protein WDA75_17350 [Candidatus Latescibacterota bacterium]|jgi:phenylpyruvate tautomerase PptA (4-oxalocrotonate tautomerase family)